MTKPVSLFLLFVAAALGACSGIQPTAAPPADTPGYTLELLQHGKRVRAAFPDSGRHRYRSLVHSAAGAAFRIRDHEAPFALVDLQFGDLVRLPTGEWEVLVIGKVALHGEARVSELDGRMELEDLPLATLPVHPVRLVLDPMMEQELDLAPGIRLRASMAR